MKKANQFGLAAVVVACSTAVHAQSSVTLYGLIDVGINYINNAQVGRDAANRLSGKSLVSMSDGGTRGVGGSRWGLRGTEALGGGLSAIFTLENGFNEPNGTIAQGGALFGRQSFVGLSGDFGTLTLGRQYDILADVLANYTPAFFAGISGAAPGDIDGYGRTRRINNAIKFASANYRGFSVDGMYALGNTVGDFTRGQLWALTAAYAAHGFSAGVGYLNARDPNLSTFGTNPNSGGPTTNNLGSAGSATSAESNPIYAGYASAHSYESYSAGTSYIIGPVTLAASFSHVAFDNLGDLSAGPNPLHYRGNAIFNNGTGAVAYMITPSLQLGSGYTYTHGGGAGGAGSSTYHQFVGSVQYFLSKRTTLYFFGTYQLALGTDSLRQAAVANVDLFTASSTNRQLIGRVGLIQRF
ncbi:porin [Caballeronia sp. 15711]|uniref:porin n=1 Tax=Caballeronia sp. 15711 TaxID=3391029 RepID=UPI0039E70045